MYTDILAQLQRHTVTITILLLLLLRTMEIHRVVSIISCFLDECSLPIIKQSPIRLYDIIRYRLCS